MARNTKPVRTFHYAAVAKSLEAQSQAVLLMLQTAGDVVNFRDSPSHLAIAIDRLKEQAVKCQALMWPADEDEG